MLQDEQAQLALQRTRGMQYLAESYERAGQPFIPLVTEELGLRCKLDILFLRPENPGSLFVRGDLDNRLKTLFDGLRIANDKQELGNSPLSAEPI